MANRYDKEPDTSLPVPLRPESVLQGVKNRLSQPPVSDEGSQGNISDVQPWKDEERLAEQPVGDGINLDDLRETLQEDRSQRTGEYDPQPITGVEPGQIWDLAESPAILNPQDLVEGGK